MDLSKLAASIREATTIVSSQPIDIQQREELSRACESLSAILEQPRSRLEKATHAVSIKGIIIISSSHFNSTFNR